MSLKLLGIRKISLTVQFFVTLFIILFCIKKLCSYIQCSYNKSKLLDQILNGRFNEFRPVKDLDPVGFEDFPRQGQIFIISKYETQCEIKILV